MPSLQRKRPLGARIRRFCYRWCDQLKLAEFWCFVVSGVLISVACTYFFAKAEFAQQVIALKNDYDDRYSTLNDTIQSKLGPVLEKVEDVSDQQSQLVDKVDSAVQTASTAAVRSKQAASTASRAASQAGQAVKKSLKPVRSLRLNPSPVWKEPKCYMGRDLYGDNCK